MAFRDMIEQDADQIFFNTDEFAETVVHWPAGEAGSAVNITAVFIPEESRRELQRGYEVVRPAMLWVDNSVSVTSQDVYVVGGICYQVIRFDAVEYGARRVELQRNDKSHTSRPSGGALL